MKKTIFLLSTILISVAAFCQVIPKSGEGCANGVLYDSGGVSVSVIESQVLIPYCTAKKDTRGCIFKCDFFIKNLESQPVVLTKYIFTMKTTDATIISDQSCDPVKYGKVERDSVNRAIAPHTTVCVTIYGEAPYGNNPICCYSWMFEGYTAQNSVSR